MQALRPKLELSPSPSPDIPAAQVSRDILCLIDFSNTYKIRPSSGDAVLVSYLDNGRRPEIARVAGAQALPGADEDLDDDNRLLDSAPSRTCTNIGDASHITISTPILQHLAADALQAVSAESPLVAPPRASLDISTSARQLSISDERPQLVATYPSYRHPSRASVHADASTSTPASATGELPPLQMDSPKSETNGQNLPSIRSTFGDIKCIHSERGTPADKDMASLHSAAAFSHSPPLSRPRLPPMSASHVSPPISPGEAYQRSLPSPHSLPASSPYSYYHPKGLAHRPSLELGTITAGEPPATDQSVLTPATSASVADPMSIDGITNPSGGIYACTFSGCTAPPFQTQYLLNSHANVHSSARPHYCPVKGCPRSEGGKGFKRKNEMIRHGLVHDSPGYVCPFCPDREHKYPRPDNLQRHVRVHHVDKDKDDPLLREVLSQRPDGPNRGRRKRGVIT
ncbi:hypothetical protein CDD80_4718 [Ophiocordyceps camponoti-rufipedis]|uniref:C2H2-type domain-containing protein n=1 Tax=Ophiocordyceps camponoti-rufipedis TaxID=2004952 RepID=A0A2C5XH48_9HYPO|nr:hypothetical protein CDD80_4718 [Ophiocordyceps camponoti-rufipedis]